MKENLDKEKLWELLYAFVNARSTRRLTSESTTDELMEMLRPLDGNQYNRFAPELATILMTSKTEQEMIDRANEAYARIQL